MSLTKLSLGGNNDVIYKLFPPRESLVSDIPAGDGNIEKLFLQCRALPAPFQLSICIQVWALPWKTSGQFLFIILFAYIPGQPGEGGGRGKGGGGKGGGSCVMDKLEGAELDRPGHIITRTKPGLHNPTHTHAQQTEINNTFSPHRGWKVVQT
jgi:hypothetical protein